MVEAETKPAELDRSVVRGTERALRRRFGGRPRVASYDVLNDGRAVVARCHLSGAASMPETVVLKVAKDMSEESPAWSFGNEWAGLEFLERFEYEENAYRVAPRLYGVDAERSLLALEDLGDGESLADILLADDASKAEAALIAYAHSLGRMHAITSGLAEEYREVVEATRLLQDRRGGFLNVRAQIEKLPETFAELDFEWSPGMVDDVQQVAAAMLRPGRFGAYTHGDPCPDNDRLIDGRMVFFDFERGGYRNAFLDGCYGRAPFPTCWCVNRLPEWLVTRMETAYRLELMRALPELEDDAVFERAIIEACAMWLIDNANALLPRALRLEQTWGISTYRQRLVYRFEAFAQTAARFEQLESLGAWAVIMCQRMRLKWPEVQDMPLYPAFRSTTASSFLQ